MKNDEISIIEDVKETFHGMQRLLMQADEVLSQNPEKRVKKRVTRKRRREAVFFLIDRNGALQNEGKKYILREERLKPGRKTKLMIQFTSMQRVTEMRKITEVKMKKINVDPKELRK